MKKMVLLTAVMAALGVAAQAAEVSRWLGTGGNNKWTDAANWDNGVPGACKYSVEGGSVINDGLAVTAVFGAVAEGAALTIDLTDVLAVSNLTIVAGAPAYVFGTSGTQAYRVHSNGGITIEEGVESDQTFCRLFPAKWGAADKLVDANGGSNTTSSHYYHHGSGEMVVHNFLNSYNHTTCLHGAGTFVITNNITSTGGFLQDYTTGRVVMGNVSDAGYFKSFKHYFTEGSTGHTVAIPAGRTFCVRDSASSGLTVLNAEADVLYTGEGLFYFRNSSTTKTQKAHTFYFKVAANKTATFDVDIHAGSYYAKPTPALLLTPIYVSGNGTGTVEWKKRFLVASGYEPGGYYTFDANGTLRLSKMGNLGQGSQAGYNFGELEPVFNTSGTIEWTGGGDSVDRTLGFNANSKVTATLKNSGTGALIYTGIVTQKVDACTLALNAAAAPIEFRGSKGSNKTLNLAVAGASLVTVADLGLFAKVDISGTLAFEAASGNLASMVFSTRSPDSRVLVPENFDLIITGAEQNGSTSAIDFIVPASSTLTFAGHAAGDIVSWCKMNGVSCYSDQNGRIHAYRKDWREATSGDWGESAKWTGGELPQAKDSAYITVGGASYTVRLNATPAIKPSALTVGTGEGAHTATLAVNGLVGLTNCYFSVKQGGEVLVDGPESSLILYGANYLAKAVDGGRVVVTNGGDFRISSNFRVAGELVVSDGSSLRPNELNATRNLTVAPANAGETARIAFLGAPGTRNTLGSGILYAGGTKGGTVKVDLHGTGVENFTPPADGDSGNGIFGWYLGVGDGLTLSELTGGHVNSGNWGVRVGSTSKSATPIAGECFPTGIVTMTGGKLTYSGWNNAAQASYCGLIVGDGALVESAGNATRAYGEFNFAGGELAANCGYFMVGVGQGEGVFNQSGGTVNHKSTSFTSPTYFKPDGSGEYVFDAYIGLAGARGTYTQTGGTFSTGRDVYVGGREVADMGRSINGVLAKAYHDGLRQDAYGKLCLLGGSFGTTARVLLGAWGTGELELGNHGYLSADGLVMSNATASVLRAEVNNSTRFEVTGQTSGGILLKNKLVLTDGAKLVIDASSAGRPIAGYRQLVKCARVEGEFAEVEILVDSALNEADRRRILEGEVIYSRGGACGVWYRSRPTGTVLIIR